MDAPLALFPRVLVGGHFVGPGGDPTEAAVDLHERLVGGGTVPVEHIGGCVIAFARPELPHRLTPLLQPHPSLLDQQELATGVAVPVSACAGFETPPCD